MPDASAVFEDGDLPHGTFALSITDPGDDVDAVVYIANDVEPTEPTVMLTSLDENGVPARQKAMPDFSTGTATLQLATSTTAPPMNGATFSADVFKRGGTAPAWFITSVGMRYGNGSETMVNIGFRKQIN